MCVCDLQITNTMNMLVQIATLMETNIVSVERISEYSKVDTEVQFTFTY
jgi:hypothetical protein